MIDRYTRRMIDRHACAMIDRDQCNSIKNHSDTILLRSEVATDNIDNESTIFMVIIQLAQ